MNSPLMYQQDTYGLESVQNFDVDEGFEEIFFNLLKSGNKQLAKKYARNYLKNFYKDLV